MTGVGVSHVVLVAEVERGRHGDASRLDRGRGLSAVWPVVDELEAG
jgi:hypothetical protein